MLAELKKKDHRMTKQRKIVLEELKKVCNHPTAAQLHTMVSKRIPNISLTTIYRNLDFLEENKLVKKLRFKDKETRYDGNLKCHCHLVCEKCHKIIDLFDITDIKIQSKQMTAYGFRPSLEHLDIPGVCADCRF